MATYQGKYLTNLSTNFERASAIGRASKSEPIFCPVVEIHFTKKLSLIDLLSQLHEPFSFGVNCSCRCILLYVGGENGTEYDT